MARSIQYWYDYIITEKNTMAGLNVYQPNIDTAQTLLSDLTTTSKIARWRLFVWAVASCVHALDVIFDLALIAFEALAKRTRFGTIPWYIQIGYEFQFGDTLVFQNNEYQYPVVNTANQIIKRAAAQESGNTVNIKLAQLVGGVITKLNPAQYAAASAYYALKKPAGIMLNIISDDPDELRLSLKVNYDPLVLDNTGQLLTTPGVYPAQDAANNYLLSVVFNGKIELADLIQLVDGATGVESVYLNYASARYGANPFIAFTERYYSNAGYTIIDPTQPLSSSFIYQSNV